MSPIEVIRKQLDERGIEWWTVESLDKVPLTVCVIDGVRYKFRPQGRGIIVSSCTEGTVTAEQAIAMTVGVGTCTMKPDGYLDEEYSIYVCSYCGEKWQFNHEGPKENRWEYCPRCRTRIEVVTE